MNTLLNALKLFVKRNSSIILTVIGGAGVIATSIMAVRETPKALKLIEDAKAVEEAGAFAVVLECVPAGLTELDEENHVSRVTRYERHGRLEDLI